MSTFICNSRQDLELHNWLQDFREILECVQENEDLTAVIQFPTDFKCNVILESGNLVISNAAKSFSDNELRMATVLDGIN